MGRGANSSSEGSPLRLGQVLTRVVARLGLDRNLDDYRILQAWDEVVGPLVAANAQPTRLDARRLVVAVRNTTWMQELTLLRKELCRRLNGWMGREVVGEIFLVIGKIERVEAPAPPRRAATAAPASKVDGDIDAAIARLWKALRDRDSEPD